MSKKTKTGAPAAAGRAELRLFAIHRQPMRAKTPAQIASALEQMGFRCDTFTLRHDVSTWHARETLHLSLRQARGALMALEDHPELHDHFRLALGGVVTLTDRAIASLAVLMTVGEL